MTERFDMQGQFDIVDHRVSPRESRMIGGALAVRVIQWEEKFKTSGNPVHQKLAKEYRELCAKLSSQRILKKAK